MAAVGGTVVPGARAASAASGDPIVFDGTTGTNAPPDQLGPYSMTPFDVDTRVLDGANDTSIVFDALRSPIDGLVTVSPPFDQHGRVGVAGAGDEDWWGHEYAAGDVYWACWYVRCLYTPSGPQPVVTVTLTLPDNTSAFYFYVKGGEKNPTMVTATAQEGTSSGAIPVGGDSAYDPPGGSHYFGFYAKGSAHLTSIMVSGVNSSFAIGQFGISQGKYVALGDSYSSGESNAPYRGGTDGPTDFCHRSDTAYPVLIGTDRHQKPEFYACSGAVTSDITSTSRYGEPPQLSHDGVNQATLVTMTIGGNDAHFSDVLQRCIEQRWVVTATIDINALNPVSRWLNEGLDPSCVHSPAFWSSVVGGVRTAAANATQAYAAVKANVSKDATVVAGDYPRLFPASAADQSCSRLAYILTGDDMNYLNGAADELDDGLAAAAASAGVGFAEVRPYFVGHEICGPQGEWVHGLTWTVDRGKPCTLTVLGACIIPAGTIGGSFHPNVGGHEAGYAPAFEAAIAAAGHDSLVSGPRAVTQAVTMSDAAPADSFGTLEAQPVTPSAPECAGTYQAGQQVRIAAAGFAPGVPVEVYVTSPGLGATAATLVATLTADSTGDASATVRIPFAATGFAPQGAAGGLIFLDAIGLDPVGSHRAAGAMAGLAPHGSDCGAVDALPFTGFAQPVPNLPAVGAAQPGRTIPVKFAIPGFAVPLSQMLAPGYPQSAPVSCSDPATLTAGEPTVSVASGNNDDAYHYEWKTRKSWHDCRELIVGLADGTYHRAVIDFG